MEKQFLSIKEVSRMTGLSVATLQRWIWKRIGFPFIKAGRRVLYDADDIWEFMEKNKIKPETED